MAEERAAWREEVAAGRLDPAGLIFVDESGIDTRMTRRFARAKRGERTRGAAPFGRWRRLTLVGAPGLGGLVAAMTVAAPTDTGIFHAFVEQVLAPASRDRPGALVAMDNLAPHKAAIVHDAIRAAGLGSRLLPRHSPDLAVLVQDQDLAPRQAGPLARRPRPRVAGRARRRHARGRPWLVPALRLSGSGLTRNLL